MTIFIETLWPFIQVLFGLGVVILGTYILVEAGLWLIKVSGAPDLFVGSTFLSLITISLECFMGWAAITHGRGEMIPTMIMGIVLMSLGVVLALNLMVSPRLISKRKFLWQSALLLFSLIVFWFLGRDGKLTRSDSYWLLVLATGIIVFNWWGILWGIWVQVLSKAKSKLTRQELAFNKKNAAQLKTWGQAQFKQMGVRNLALNLARLIIGTGLVFLAVGYFWRNWQGVAGILNWNDQLVALVVLAVAAVLPILVTTIAVIRHKKTTDLSVGSLLGVGTLSLSLVIGLFSWLGTSDWAREWQAVVRSELASGWRIVGPTLLSETQSFLVTNEVINFDIPLALLMMMVIIIPSLWKGKLYRAQGAALFLMYLSYIVFWIFAKR